MTVCRSRRCHKRSRRIGLIRRRFRESDGGDAAPASLPGRFGALLWCVVCLPLLSYLLPWNGDVGVRHVVIRDMLFCCDRSNWWLRVHAISSALWFEKPAQATAPCRLYRLSVAASNVFTIDGEGVSKLRSRGTRAMRRRRRSRQCLSLRRICFHVSLGWLDDLRHVCNRICDWGEIGRRGYRDIGNDSLGVELR